MSHSKTKYVGYKQILILKDNRTKFSCFKIDGIGNVPKVTHLNYFIVKFPLKSA